MKPLNSVHCFANDTLKDECCDLQFERTQLSFILVSQIHKPILMTIET